MSDNPSSWIPPTDHTFVEGQFICSTTVLEILQDDTVSSELWRWIDILSSSFYRGDMSLNKGYLTSVKMSGHFSGGWKTEDSDNL